MISIITESPAVHDRKLFMILALWQIGAFMRGFSDLFEPGFTLLGIGCLSLALLAWVFYFLSVQK